MKEKIILIEKGKEGVVLPEEYLRSLELIPGAEVEIELDREKRRIIIKPVREENFLKHFRDSMETMA